MIVCYKCGGKYEDDMPRCLWCDALNPEHPLNKEPAPSLTEKASAQASPGIAVPPVVKQTVVEQVAPVATETLPDAGASDIKSCETSPELGDTVAVVEPGREQDVAIERQFRQKGILWSVVLAGPFISWLCHYKSLKLVDRFSTKFFLPLFGIQCAYNYMAFLLSKLDLSGIGGIGLFLQGLIIVVVCLLYWFLIGKLGLVLLKKAVPDYDPKVLKKRERIGIVVGIPIFILEFLAGYLHYGSTARMLGFWLGSALQ